GRRLGGAEFPQLPRLHPGRIPVARFLPHRPLGILRRHPEGSRYEDPGSTDDDPEQGETAVRGNDGGNAMKRFCIAMTVMLVASAAHARELGTVGATYAIAERDALAE